MEMQGKANKYFTPWWLKENLDEGQLHPKILKYFLS